MVYSFQEMLSVLDKCIANLYFSGFRSYIDCSVILLVPLLPFCFSASSYIFSLKNMIIVFPSHLLEPHLEEAGTVSAISLSIPGWVSSGPANSQASLTCFFLTLVRALTHLSPMFIVLAIWPHLSWLVKTKQKRHLNTPVFPISNNSFVFSLRVAQYFLFLVMHF